MGYVMMIIVGFVIGFPVGSCTFSNNSGISSYENCIRYLPAEQCFEKDIRINFKLQEKVGLQIINTLPKRKSIKWSKEEDQYLIDNYSAKGLRRCTIFLNLMFKNERTERAAHCRAGELKCRTTIPPTHYTTKEISDMFDITESGIVFNIRSGKIKAVKSNARYLIPDSELSKIESLFEPDTAGYMSVMDFSSKIGVEFRGVHKNISLYDLPKIVLKGKAYVPKQLCDIICLRMKQTGSARVDWIYAQQTLCQCQTAT